jgi:integrase/recombinase XerD
MRISRAIHDFIDGYFSTCRRSIKTKEGYRCDLDQFLAFTGACAWLHAIRPELVEKWICDLKERGYAPASIQRKIAALKAMFHYWVRKDMLKVSPAWKLRIDFDVRRVMPRALTSQQASALLATARRDVLLQGNRPRSSAHFLAVRNCALIDLFLETGVRVSEMASISISDIDLGDQTILIKGKGGRERMAILMDEITLAALQSYIQLRAALPSDTDRLWMSVHKKPLQSRGIADIVTRLSEKAGISVHVTPHMLRHTVATLMLQNGIDLRIVQEVLGHASITTTQRYTHITKTHLRDALSTRHPIFRLRAV